MKKILILLIILTIFVSCKSTKPSCDAYGKTNLEKNG